MTCNLVTVTQMQINKSHTIQVEELRQQVRMLHAVSCNSVSEEDGEDARSPGECCVFLLCACVKVL